MSNFEINIREAVHVGNRRIGRLPSGITRWKRTRKLKGGAYSGTATVETGDLRSAYHSWLGRQLHENNGRDWHGIIHEMIFTHDGMTEKISLDNVINSVACVYVDSSGDEPIESITAFVNDDDSVEMYGQIQGIINVDGDINDANQANLAYLTRYAWPLAEQIGIHPSDLSQKLVIQVSGPVYLLRWHYPNLAATLGESGATVAALVTAICADHPYITAGDIGGSEIVTDLRLYQSSLAYLNDLLKIGDIDGAPNNFWIDDKFRLNYGPIPTEYAYTIINGRFTKKGAGLAQIDARSIRPGVVRQATMLVGKRPGSWLPDRRDTLIDEVTVDENGQLRPGRPEGLYIANTSAVGSSVSSGTIRSASGSVAGPWQPNIGYFTVSGSPFFHIKTNMTALMQLDFGFTIMGFAPTFGGGTGAIIDSIACGTVDQSSGSFKYQVSNRESGGQFSLYVALPQVSNDDSICIEIFSIGDFVLNGYAFNRDTGETHTIEIVETRSGDSPY